MAKRSGSSAPTRRIVDAVSGKNGATVKVKLSGNTGYTPADTAVRMAERGQIAGAHAVHSQGGSPYLRSNPDGRAGNNIDRMCGDK